VDIFKDKLYKLEIGEEDIDVFNDYGFEIK